MVAALRKQADSVPVVFVQVSDPVGDGFVGHTLQRVTRYAAVIGTELGLSDEDLERLQAGALLHDYGKIAVRDRFLQKPGKLDDAEFAYMKAHAEKTAEFLSYLDFPPDMREVPEIAAQHHERMDGKGYPKGLTREQMSVQARVMGIADIFEALTAKDRPYKPGKTLSESLGILGRMKENGHVDPDLFDIFVRDKVYLRYAHEFLDPEQIDDVDEAQIPGYRPRKE